MYGRSAVRRASRIANLGCYAMSAQLLLGPLVKAGLVPPGVWLTVFELSGYSGADTVACEKDSSGRPTTEPNVSPVSLRHEREAKRHLVALLPAALAGEMKVAFVPSVALWFSGILSVLSVPLSRKVAAREVRALYNEMYTGEHLITVGAVVLGLADVEKKHGRTVGGYQVHSEGGRFVVGGLDNLLKGATTQFLQNVNLALGYDEHAGIPVT
ncbi:protein ARG5,6, mitochondrial precursor [Phellopilus nigrolimitatus]|nr:protein ARG5,6, mitochondrial precursor [Phellopilus nigrolimitatus]